MPPRPVPIRVRKTVPDSWIELVLTEGKNRQVRRMTAAVGHPTLRLVRVGIGTIGLDGLSPGCYQALSNQDRSALVESLNGLGSNRQGPGPKRSKRRSRR